MDTPELNSSWRYIGKQPGYGDTHKVILINWESIVTVSENCFRLGTSGEVYSWLGSKDEFFLSFAAL